ncbi:hypothetical protein [Methanolapillus africanus]
MKKQIVEDVNIEDAELKNKGLYQAMIEWVDSLSQEEVDAIFEKYGTAERIPGQCYSIHDEYVRQKELENKRKENRT